MTLALAGEWRGRALQVTARLIPRFLWTTASIDVFLDACCVLQTGGKMKLTGGSTARFEDSGTIHDIELTWGRARLRWFPVKITIDGQLVADSKVFVDNWPLELWPSAVLVGAVAWLFWRP